ncbi:MAG: ribosome silencing factor [Clostridia bacterium]|nr:ribosome silencing factor [Clostridia bacterium]MDD4685737.1 ribosome silencing factor [Clostridia bacterium]
MDYLGISEKIVNKLNDLGARKIEVLDVSKKTSLSKVLIFASVSGKENSKEIALKLEEFLKTEEIELEHIDGHIKGDWIVLDFKEIIVHLFQNEIRVKYDMEKLWKDNKNSIKINIETK